MPVSVLQWAMPPDAVKAGADYVTASVEEGGIADALDHFGILD